MNDKRQDGEELVEQSTEIKSKINHLLQKVNETYQETRTIDEDIVSAYREFLEIEKRCKKFAEKDGLMFQSNVSGVIAQELMETRKAVQRARKRLEDFQMPEDTSKEQVDELEKSLKLVTERVGEGVHITSELSKVVKMYKSQSNYVIKRQLYEEAFELINMYKICKLEDEKRVIESEPVGLLDRITGKGKIKRLRLANIDLELSLLKDAKPTPKNNYSVRDILADIYTIKETKMRGYQTPSLNDFFETLRSNFGINGNKITIDEIKELAKPRMDKLQHGELPVIPNKKFGFSSTREQRDRLEEENAKLKRDIDYSKTRRFNEFQPKELGAINTFKQLLTDIRRNFTEEGQAKAPLKEGNKDNIDLS